MPLKEDPLYSPSPDGIKTAVLYPNAYSLGMSNLGFHSLCRLVGETCGLTLERYFADNIKAGRVVSLEGSFDLGRQSVLLVTINYEEDALLLLKILKAAGIEPDRRKRKKPAIIIGGALVNIAPDLFLNIADVLFTGYLGKGQKDLLRQLLLKREDKNSFCLPLKKEKGFYIPGASKKYSLHFPQDGLFEDSAFLAENTEFSRMFLMETGRGCPFECHFCSVCHLYPNPAWRPLHDIREKFESARKMFGSLIQRVGLIAPVPNLHPEIKALLSFFACLDMEVSLSSLRAEKTDKEFFGLLKKCRQRSFTIAPEVPDEKARKKLGKNITDDALFTCLEHACSSGFTEVKMYFLMGCKGLENQEDAASLEGFLRKIPGKMKVRLSFNPLVPKPGTRLEGDALADLRSLKSLMKDIKKSCSKFGNVHSSFGNLKSFALQYKIANGDENTLVSLFNEQHKRDQLK